VRTTRTPPPVTPLASLNHPNVAGIHGIDQDGDTSCLAMELVPGEGLEERLKRGTLPFDEALDGCRQVAEGLEAAREAGIVHRDMKPANVRITLEGVVKILDFGLAKPIGPNAQGSGSTSAQLDRVLARTCVRVVAEARSCRTCRWALFAGTLHRAPVARQGCGRARLRA
jgi:serine/threonine protein kinase